MISLKVRLLLLPLAAAFLTQLQAGNSIWLTPPSSSNQIQVFSEEPFAPAGTLTIPAPRWRRLFPTPDGAKVFFIGEGGDALYVYTSDLRTQVRSYPLATSSQYAAMTPDGRRFIVAAGSLRIFDTSTAAEISPAGGIDVGLVPGDVAASLDSTKAYVLQPNNHRMVAVDLATNQVRASPGTFPASPTGIAVAPNGVLYVSATNIVFEVDPTTLETRGQIPVNGSPDQLLFTPDSTKAAAINKFPITGTWLIVFDLTSRAVLGTLPYNFAETPSSLIMAGSDYMYGVSPGLGDIYRITFSPVDVQYAAFGYLGNVFGTSAAVATYEYPSPGRLYVADQQNLYQLDDRKRLLQATVPIAAPGTGLIYMATPSTAAPNSAVQYNDNQNLATGASSLPLVVRVLDASGKPVWNVPVTWSTTASGAALQAATAVTNTAGLAQTVVTAPTALGQIRVAAAIGATGQIQKSFTVNVSNNPGATTGVSTYAGNGQIVYSGRGSDAIVAQVLDSDGKPVAGVEVSWVMAQGGGFLVPAKSTTDAKGMASTQYFGGPVVRDSAFAKSDINASAAGYGSGVFHVTSIPFSLVDGSLAQPPALQLLQPDTPTITAKIGQTIPGAIIARAAIAANTVQLGSPMSDVGLEFQGAQDPASGPVAACQTRTVLSSVDGQAVCDLRVTGSPGTRQITLTFGGSATVYSIALTATVGDPGQIKILSGDGQTAAPGLTLGTDLLAEVSDGYGNVLPGVDVAWEVLPATAAAFVSKSSKSDASGHVTARVTAGTTTGTFQIRVKPVVGAGVATFNEAVAVTLAQPVKVSGDSQSAIVSQPFAQPVVIQLNDLTGKTAPSIPVAFAVTAGSATLSGASTLTDAQGRASANVTAGSTAGAITVTVTVSTFTLTFNLTARPPGPVVTAADIFNAAGSQPGVTPGGIVTIRGKGIAPGLNGMVTPNAIIGPLPLKLADVEVLFGTVSAPIVHVANTGGIEEVTVQAPYELGAPGSVSVTVKVAGSSTVVNGVPVVALQPGIFETTSGTARYAVMLRADGSYVSPQNPAKAGEIVKIFATGLGQTSTATGTGRAGVPGQSVVASLIIGVNNGGVRVISAETMVGAVGMYIVTFEVPPDAAAGSSQPLALAVISPDGLSLNFGNGSNFAIQR